MKSMSSFILASSCTALILCDLLQTVVDTTCRLQDGGDGTFASDSDRDVEITSSRSAPETSFSLGSAPSKSSTSHSPFASAAPAASSSGMHASGAVLVHLK